MMWQSSESHLESASTPHQQPWKRCFAATRRRHGGDRTAGRGAGRLAGSGGGAARGEGWRQEQPLLRLFEGILCLALSSSKKGESTRAFGAPL